MDSETVAKGIDRVHRENSVKIPHLYLPFAYDTSERIRT